eukprot:TRINITY_DN141_c0_g2_i1.p1 TRINITY_DN141_c0_g2~~TRINITY_DN141_c0_g2_i1.p1  ORF type:complete len:629 (-),score=109.63 TRINITY_DN141_c0_g2_i1:254-2140(-)
MTISRQRTSRGYAWTLSCAVFMVSAQAIFGDVYMHNPRGSNDRNCERNQNRNNGNRLFDSQNNDQGGYACPRAVGGPETFTPQMYYYTGSLLTLEWTSQHSCGKDSNANCEIVIQYMCEDQNPGLRDGTPSNQNDAATDRMEAGDINNPRFGYHETLPFYEKCNTRRRNTALWIADQNIATTSPATRTRQNPNGARRGWECPEERDYYPYWHPAPWKDIAILTNNVDRCSFYRKNSQNVATVGECLTADGKPTVFNTFEECQVNSQVWKTQTFNLPAPECLENPLARDNHLGNMENGYMVNYNWTIPNTLCERAVLRIRYNISTFETPWELTAAQNKAQSPVLQDPYVNIGLTEKYNLSLALNTNQYGRTFQDRSYVFAIKKAPVSGKIYNLNVRGKRGNIVDVFPSVEYDFVPQVLTVKEGDLIHFQWTGSDYNPDERPNNAEGGPVDPADGNSRRADRSNIVQIPDAKSNVPVTKDKVTLFSSDKEIQLMYKIGQENCLTLEQLINKHKDANGNVNNDNLEADSQNCMKLNAAKTPYFDAGLIKMKNTGTHHYMSSRNNNFSNRCQKAVITVEPVEESNVAAIAAGTTVAVAAVAGVAGTFYYGKTHPDSKLNELWKKVPGANRYM